MIEDNRYYWSHLKTKNVTVRVNPKTEAKGVVFRVSNMIDLGNGRQTAVLDHVDFPESSSARRKKENVFVPFRMGDLDFVYTSRQNPFLQNTKRLLSCLYKGARIERIVPDVLCPGDILVFKPQDKSMNIKMVDAFRIIKQDVCTSGKATHAV